MIYELIFEFRRTRDFGAVILFGSGGIGVELFKDVSIGLPPLNQVLARRIIEDTNILRSPAARPEEQAADRHEVVGGGNGAILQHGRGLSRDRRDGHQPARRFRGKALRALDTRIIVDATALEHTEQYQHLVIMPYPSKYVTPWKLKDGTDVILRPIRSEDEPIESEFIKGLSERDKSLQVLPDHQGPSARRPRAVLQYRLRQGDGVHSRDYGTERRRVESRVARLIIEPNREEG